MLDFHNQSVPSVMCLCQILKLYFWWINHLLTIKDYVNTLNLTKLQLLTQRPPLVSPSLSNGFQWKQASSQSKDRWTNLALPFWFAVRLEVCTRQLLWGILYKIGPIIWHWVCWYGTHCENVGSFFFFFFFFLAANKIHKLSFCFYFLFVRKVWKSSQIIWNPVKSEPYDLSNEIDMRKNYFNYRQQYYSSRVWENIMV